MFLFCGLYNLLQNFVIECKIALKMSFLSYYSLNQALSFIVLVVMYRDLYQPTFIVNTT